MEGRYRWPFHLPRKYEKFSHSWDAVLPADTSNLRRVLERESAYWALVSPPSILLLLGVGNGDSASAVFMIAREAEGCLPLAVFRACWAESRRGARIAIGVQSFTVADGEGAEER